MQERNPILQCSGYRIPGAGLIILELKLKFHTFYSLGYVIKKPRGS